MYDITRMASSNVRRSSLILNLIS